MLACAWAHSCRRFQIWGMFVQYGPRPLRRTLLGCQTAHWIVHKKLYTQKESKIRIKYTLKSKKSKKSKKKGKDKNTKKSIDKPPSDSGSQPSKSSSTRDSKTSGDVSEEAINISRKPVPLQHRYTRIQDQLAGRSAYYATLHAFGCSIVLLLWIWWYVNKH